MKLFNRQQSDERALWAMDTPLLHFSKQDVWTLEDAYRGVSILGMTGSGKSSGSGALLAKTYLNLGMGGLVLCAKGDEATTWLRYAQETGREEDVILFGEDYGAKFNVLHWEAHRAGRGAGHTENILEIFTRLSGLLDEGNTSQEHAFFKNANLALLRNTITALKLAKVQVTLDAIDRFIRSLPMSVEQGKSEAWRSSSVAYKVVEKARAAAKGKGIAEHDAQAVLDYVMEFAANDPRTRGNILATYSGLADLLTKGFLYDVFGTDTNVVPELTYRKNAIIIVDVPLQEYNRLGMLAAGIWKLCFQRSLLSRNIEEHPSAVFLWADEAANFLFPTDEGFQERARSNRICTVYLAQTLHSYMNGFKGNQHAAHALLGNLALKIFHQSGDTYTTQYAADLIGQRWMTVGSWNTSTNPNDTGSGGGSDAIHYEVLPREFGNLRTGGLRNNLTVDGIVFMGGRHFDATGTSWMKVEFKQGV